MIDVVGLSAVGWQDLPARERSLVEGAEVLLGSPRQLGLIPPVLGQLRLEWPKPLREGLPGLLAAQADRAVVALASGDPLVAGIGSTLVDLLGPDQVRVHPALSSVTLARAQLGWSEDSVMVIRLRGDDADLIRRDLYPGARLVVLSRDAESPREVARVATDAGCGDSRLTVLGNLGTDRQSIAVASASTWADAAAGFAAPALNVVCLEVVGDGLAASLVPGLPDEAYDNDGQLTKRDARASALARLQPRPGELLWDVGAGAGSIAIEWLRAHPRCRAFAVERDRARAKRLTENAAALGVPGLRVVEGEAPGALDGLAAPDAVFVGGGASDAVLDACWAALRPGGRMVVHAVTVETEALLAARWRQVGGELTRISVEHVRPLGSFHGWSPLRAVVCWSVVKE